jgi:hypothetical protein
LTDQSREAAAARPIFDGDGDVGVVEIWIPFQFVPDIVLYFTVGSHAWLLVGTREKIPPRE